MQDIGRPEALYTINYFSSLLNDNEKRALRHVGSTFKLQDTDNEGLVNSYYSVGWLSKDPEVLYLLIKGEDHFLINCARRIVTEHPDKVFFNLCPRCGKLARTPQARLCRFCGHDWHSL